MASEEGKAGKEKKEIRPYKPKRLCPKCGSGMAEHAGRFTCGKCGYTEFKKREKES